MQVWSYLYDLDLGRVHYREHGMKVFRLEGFSKPSTDDDKSVDKKFGMARDRTSDSGTSVREGWKNHKRANYSDDSKGSESPDWARVTDSFCSWGWFEDNVLSRFFGTVQGKELIGEFRSVEPAQDGDGNLLKMKKEDIGRRKEIYEW